MKANQDPSISLGVSTCRTIKTDVLKILKGPGGGQPSNTFVLSALSHLKSIFTVAIKDSKKKKKIEHSQEAAEFQVDIKSIKLAIKKIDFYLSWSNEYFKEFELFYK